ncbi:MAG: hypothetical protein KKD44_00930 [Proteobacteria bacterium]|nr:hypothetical protein [Pseudomonadota bacterium]
MNTQCDNQDPSYNDSRTLMERLLFWKKPVRDDLIEEFYVKLKSNYQICRQNNSRFEEYRVLTEKIDELFTLENTWNNGAFIEQLMVQLYSPEQLQVELDRKLFDIQKDKAGYYEKKSCNSLGDVEKRAVLVRLLADLNSAYKTERLEREYTLRTSLRTGIFFMVSFLVFFMQYMFPDMTESLFNIKDAGTKTSLILTALSAGWMGASFSMMMSLKRRLRISNLNDLRIQSKFGFIVSRIFIGMGASLVMFYFIQSGILKGDIFPVLLNSNDIVSRITEQGVPIRIITHKHQALLIMWCFIAGFSESLVPAILAKTEDMVR